MPRGWFWLGMAGACSGDGGKTEDTADTAAGAEDSAAPTDSADTGVTVTESSCPPEIVPVGFALCAESTLISTEPTFEFGGTALVTEVGLLEPVPGSQPLDGFSACDEDRPHQVRLVDDYGDIWTFGWDVDGDLDDASLQAILPGYELTFYAVWVDRDWEIDLAVLLADEWGPLFVFENDQPLDDAQRGLTIEVDYDDVCYAPREEQGAEMHYLVTFSWDGGQTSLRSGERVSISLPDRELDATLLGAYRQLGYQDGTPGVSWAAWADSP